MDAQFKALGGDLAIKIEAGDMQGLIQQLSELLDFFGETQCQACESKNVRPQYRSAKGFDFYSVRCIDCGASLNFGQTKEGHKLFAKRKDDQGEYIGQFGWEKYEERKYREDSPGDNSRNDSRQTQNTNSRSTRNRDDDREFF